MSNTRNMNNANNFWDFVANLQNNQGASPFAEGRGPAADFDPFQGQDFWTGPWVHRARRQGPPGPPSLSPSSRPPPIAADLSRSQARLHHPHVDEPARSESAHTPPETPAEPHHHPEPSSHNGPGHFGGSHRHHHHSPHRGRGRGPRGHHGPRGRGGHQHHPHGPPAFPFDLNALAEAFAPALFGDNNPFAHNQNNEEATRTATTTTTNNNNTNDGTFTPSIDLFSTPTSYILHASLPGAKKPEIDVTYSSTRNSITISGVVSRPDISETMMNCLVTDERREVGLFEREIKLEEGVKIDEERIGAKLEDGVLRVVVPKIVEAEEEGWESVRKVELE
ncbi:unnamed protein product [Aureobasidium mustum]|uniref:SHSP domain-containing protein n=1 Tax=Aureobasidium mustum TaxID=2773714 RepID=A0A9N8PP75_9PEZI|nr:unnamed protein product [Aureobasidium mustum]